MFSENFHLNRNEAFSLCSERLRMSVLKKSASDMVTDYYVKNRSFHEKWAQTEPDEYFTLAEQRRYLKSDLDMFYEGRILPLWIFRKDSPDKIIGRISYFNIAKGGMMNATIGYSLDSEATGEGYMTEAIKSTTEYLFEMLNFHRIEAFILSDNVASLATIERCNFICEGVKHSYMNINGCYRDHMNYYLLSNQVK